MTILLFPSVFLLKPWPTLEVATGLERKPQYLPLTTLGNIVNKDVNVSQKA